MRERVKKSPFFVAYTQIDEETFACEGKNFANRLTRICIHYGAKEITASAQPNASNSWSITRKSR
jgi:hypothetical protein